MLHRFPGRRPPGGNLERQPMRHFDKRGHVDDVVVRNEADIMHVVESFNEAPLLAVQRPVLIEFK